MSHNFQSTSYSEMWNNITNMLQDLCDQILISNTPALDEVTDAISKMQNTFQAYDEVSIRGFSIAFLNHIYGNNDYINIPYNHNKDITDSNPQAAVSFSMTTSNEQDCNCQCHNDYKPSEPSGSGFIAWGLNGVFKYLFHNRIGFLTTGFTASSDLAWAVSSTMATITKFTDEHDFDYGTLDDFVNNNGNIPYKKIQAGSGCGSSCSCECHDKPPREPGNSSPVPEGHKTLTPRTDPLILDINHNGIIDTQNLENGTFFDIDGNDGGIQEKIGWVSNGDGFLVQDLNENGKIDNISEMFGGANKNAFDDLRARIDSNRDGIIDKNDNLFNTLRVWIDANNNGLTDDNELFTLDSLGITSVGTNKTSLNKEDNGNNVSHVSNFVQNGETHISGSVDFATNQTLSHADGTIYMSDLLLPLLRGYGDVKDIIFEMYSNDELRSLVNELAYYDDSFTKANFEKLIGMWTGLDKKYRELGLIKDYNKPLSKADKLWIHEKLMGNYEFTRNIENAKFAENVILNNGTWQFNLSTWDGLSFTLTIQNYYSIFLFQKYGFVHAKYSTNQDAIVIKDHDKFRQELTDFMLSKSITMAGFLDVIQMMRTLKIPSSYIDFNKITISENISEEIKSINADTFNSLAILSNKLDLNSLLLTSPETIQELINNIQMIRNIPNGTKIIYNTKMETTIFGNSVNELLIGTSLNEIIHGNGGHDVFIGGRGNDHLKGGYGDDTYVFNRGDGQDIISDSSGSKDRIRFGEGITINDITLTMSDSSLVIGLREPGKTIDQLSDKMTIENFRNSSYWYQFGSGQIELFEFADGTVVNIETLLSQAWTDGDDNLTWYLTSLNVNMGDGNDTVTAGSFNDVIAGGRGNDRLKGGYGDDTYVFNRGDGQDIISDSSGNDNIIFTDINANEIGLHKSGSILNFSYGATDNIAINSGTIERFEFADGSYLTDSDVNYIIQQISAFAADNGVNFSNANDVRMNEHVNQIVMNQLRHDF